MPKTDISDIALMKEAYLELKERVKYLENMVRDLLEEKELNLSKSPMKDERKRNQNLRDHDNRY